MHLYPGGVFEADSENDNGRYTGTLNGDAATIRAAINDRTNWEMQDASPFDITATYFNSNTTVNVTPSALGIVENSFSSKLLIYPNPVTNTLYLTSTDTYFKYDVFNIQGKRLTTSNSEIAKTIDFSNFPNGMYLIKVQTEQTIETFKIIKE